LIRETNTTVDQAVDLTQFPLDWAGTIMVELTHWDATTPIDCNDPVTNWAQFDEVTEPHPSVSGFLGQDLANDYCGTSVCAQGGLGYTIGHCQISDEGVHSIRMTLGYCHECGG
jgi:hypothetical protein